MKNWSVYLIILFLITGCSLSQGIVTKPTTSTPVIRPTPTAPPIPTLESVTRFVEGESKIPVGQKLFVVIGGRRQCSSECNCPAVEPPPPAYSISEAGELQLRGNWEKQQISPNIVGFLGYGEWGERVNVIETLPYETPDKQIIIHSVDAKGVMVAEVAGHFYFIKPGQRWSTSADVKDDRRPGCHIVYPYYFFNYGLLAHSQIYAIGLWR
jgi:hypothetical protein